MKKIKVSNPAGFMDIDISNPQPGVDIDMVIDFLIKAKNIGCQTLCFNVECDWDNEQENLELSPVLKQEETDEEYNERIELEEIRAAELIKSRKESQEREYNRLKKLLGK